MATSRLHELSAHGVSVWIDSLSREMLETGELDRLMEEDAVVGVTSNPTIFQKALAEGAWYDEQLRAVSREIDDTTEIFCPRDGRHQGGVRLMRPVEKTDGIDRLARGRPARLRPRPKPSSRRCAQQEVDRPNLYVKIRHRAGLGRSGLHREGRPDQHHLIFSLERYAAVTEAYSRGLERLLHRGDPQGSRCELLRLRVDTEADKRLERLAAATCRGSSPSRTRSSPTNTTSTCSTTTVGTTWRRRGHGGSAACGHRRPRRTPPTAT